MTYFSPTGLPRVVPRAPTQERLAGLRKAVDGLFSSRSSHRPSHQPDKSPRTCLAWGQDALGGGIDFLDWGLPARLAKGALNELVADYADRPAAFGFLFALAALSLNERGGPVVLVATRRALADFGQPYGHGLAQMGIDVGRLILVQTGSDKEALWAMEEALRSEARPAMVAGALNAGGDLTHSRRLNLAAAAQRTPLTLLSGLKSGGTSAAVTRWRIGAATAARDRFGTIAAPRWQVTLERSRLGSGIGCQMRRSGAWLIEWSHVALRFRVVEGLADRPPVAGAGLRRVG
jgi:protein ImuA